MSAGKLRVIKGWTRIGKAWGVQIRFDDPPAKDAEEVVVVSRSTGKHTRCVIDRVLGKTAWGVVWSTRLPDSAYLPRMRRRRSIYRKPHGKTDEHGHAIPYSSGPNYWEAS